MRVGRKKADAETVDISVLRGRLSGVLQPGETLIAGSSVYLPSGWYMRTLGFRSFRDFQGRDISRELPGWPPSKKRGEPPARASVKGILLITTWFVLSALEFAWGFAGGRVDDVFPVPDDPDHRRDFQVLSADPGTIALGAPWQLDPGRNKAKPRVVLHVTDRRLLFTDPASGGLLWAVAREDVKAIDGVGATCCYLRFVDQSWIYVHCYDEFAVASDADADYARLADSIDLDELHSSKRSSARFDVALGAFAPMTGVESR